MLCGFLLRNKENKKNAGKAKKRVSRQKIAKRSIHFSNNVLAVEMDYESPQVDSAKSRSMLNVLQLIICL